MTASTVPPMPEGTPPVTVRTDTGHPIIDVHAWIAARVGAPHPRLTATLRDLAGVAPFRDRSHPSIAWADLAVAWCTARGYHVAESAPLWHDSPRLSEPFAVVLATARRAGAIAIVSVNEDPPTIYGDITTDESYWYDATTIDISCPTGHAWTWHGDGTLRDDCGERVNPIRFTPALSAPLQRCDQCVAYDEDRRSEWCDCDGSYQVICPDCGIRCHLGLPDVPGYRIPTAVRLSRWSGRSANRSGTGSPMTRSLPPSKTTIAMTTAAATTTISVRRTV